MGVMIVSVDERRVKQHTVTWDNIASTEEWLKTQPKQTWKDFFQENGYLVI